MKGLANIYFEPTGRRIAPFDDPIGETLIHNRPLKDWQAAACREADLTPINEPKAPCLVVPDTIFITGDALKRFLHGAAGQNAVLVLKSSLFAQATTPVQPKVSACEEGFVFESIRYDGGNNAQFRKVVIDPLEKVFSFPVPSCFFGTDTIKLGFPKDPIMTLHHWAHILWANQYAGGIDLLRIPKWKFVLQGLWAFVRTWSFNKWKLLSKLNRKGKKCDIHPTAIVEGSTLGDGVVVGPYARVLFSNVGDECNIMAGAQVEFCQLGEKSIVSAQTVLRFSVLYPEAFASQYLMQQCILGRQVVTTGGAFTMDLNFDKPIRVELDGELISSGQQFLGAAFGHRCKIGTGFWLAPGRMVPNESFLIRDPKTVLNILDPAKTGDGPAKVVGDRLER